MKKSKLGKYNTDTFMTKVWMSLSRDFDDLLGCDAFVTYRQIFLSEGVAGLRAIDTRIWDNNTPEFLKCQQQLVHFHKRYTHENDVWSKKELLAQALAKFKATQERIASPIDGGTITFKVLHRARSLAKKILGDYSEEDHMNLCRFGKRACAGHPFRRAYLDMKMRGPLTGSKEHIAWFKKALLSDELLSGIVKDLEASSPDPYVVCESPAMSFVPKTWKSLRSIKPHTLLGSFYTLGFGRLIQERLARCGLDITTLQEKHKEWARESSVSRKLVTADLSAASDSITRELIRKILPLPWFRAAMLGRSEYCTVGKEKFLLNSISTMGDGHTFPLQTLIFYCLVTAIKELVGVKGRVSVYGDDLMYPRAIHRYVCEVFPKLHLILNMDKTFSTSFYRESCGGDYYHGFDVRPSSPEAECQRVTRNQYLVFIYKVLNGLMRRWGKEQLPSTVEYLLTEIIEVDGRILQVPPFFPDSSGYRLAHPIVGNSLFSDIQLMEQDTIQGLSFPYIHVHSDFRPVVSQTIYLWEALRSRSSPTEPSIYDDDTDLLEWLPARTRPRFTTIKARGERVKRLVAHTAIKGNTRIKRQVGSTSRWT